MSWLSSSASSTFNRLHSWFTFNSTTRSISGVPLPEDVGWTLLTIKTECNHVTNLEDKDADPCKESSDEFKLIVHILSWSDFLAPRIKSTESSTQSSLELSSMSSVGRVESSTGEHGCGDDSVVASLVLCVSINDLNAKDRFHLVAKLSDFLSIPISGIIVESSSSYTLRAMANGFQMVSAGPGSGEICSLVQNVELLWQLPCSTVKHLTDFLRVLQHNVDGGRLADEINAGIVGWYVASSNPLMTKHHRRRRQAGQRTVVPTPVLQPVRPTTVAFRDDDVIMSSSALAPPIEQWSSSVQPIPEKHEDSLIEASSSVLSSLTSVVISASAQPLFSLSSTSHELSWSVLHPSPSVLDMLSEIQSTVMQESVSSASHSATSSLHLHDSGVLVPFMTEILPELPDQSTHVYFSIVLSESTLSVITTLSRPEPTSVAVSGTSGLLEESLTSASQEVIAEDVGRVTSRPVELPESEHLLPSGVFSSSNLPSLSLLLLDSDLLVTSRTVEVWAFPFTSVDTESSTAAIPSTDVDTESGTSAIPSTDVDTESSTSAIPSTDMDAESGISDIPSTDMDAESGISDIPSTDVGTESGTSVIPSTDVDTESGIFAIPSTDVDTESGASAIPSTAMDAESGISSRPSTDVDTESGISARPSTDVAESGTSAIQSTGVDTESGISSRPSTDMDTESGISAIPSTDEGLDTSAEPSSGPEFRTLTTSSDDIESSDVAKSSLEFSVDVGFSHYVSDEIAASIPQDVYENTTAFEYSITRHFQSVLADTQDAGQDSLLITQSPSELLASTLLLTSDTVAVEFSVTVTPSHDLSDEVTSVLDTIPAIDIDLITGQILTASVTERDISHTAAVEESYTSVILHIYSETVLQSVEPPLTTSGYDVEGSLWSAETLIMPSAVTSASAESELSSELMASLSTVIATSFTSATTELVAAHPSALLSPDITGAAVEETSSWIPSIPTEADSPTEPTDAGIDGTNQRPYVKHPISHIRSQQGRLLRFVIPQDVFMDREDGNTSSLTLSLMSKSIQELPGDFWLYLDQMVLTGLPLLQDMDMNNVSILLVATDKGGLSAMHSITVQIVDAPKGAFTHEFIMKFALNYEQFMHSRRHLPELLNKIAEYYNDNDTQFMTVLDVSRGSLVLSWTNSTLVGPVCQMDVIKDLLDKMVRRDGTVRPSFYRHVGRSTNLTEILFEPRGSCYFLPTTTIATTTTYFVSDSSRARGLSVWAHVILPVMIAVLVFVLIILIIVFCNRRRRHRQAVLNVEKEAVSNDRNPIFFPDELEPDDPSLKARDPLVLPTDPHPNSPNTPQDLSPSKNSRDEEITSNQDPVEQEWVTKENTEAEQVHEKKPEPKRRKGSKKQIEQGKDSGVSASSTLTWDRPNNHYLEEEAGSRSSTLNSTKSQGSEKRHPKSPPPYWQSQADPPPYRLPPPYLTETTSQV